MNITQEYLEFAIELSQENPGMGIIELKEYIEAAWDASFVDRFDVMDADGSIRDYFYEYKGSPISDRHAEDILRNAGIEL